MSKQNQLAKTCFNCGLQKQISAFLQISGPEGTSYGNICSTCRGSGLGKEIVIPEKENEERHSSGSTGLKIDAKTKVHIETEKKQQKQNQKELEIKETKKRESTQDELLERKDKKNEAEQKHRQGYLEPKKKDSFLNYQSQKPPQKPFTTSEKEAVIKKTALDQHGILDTLHKEEAAKHEEKVNAINLTESYVDPSQTGELKFQSAEFMKVKAWLGAGSAIRTYERQFLTKSAPTHNTNTTAAQTHNADDKKDSVADYINETFEPNSPGSRRR
jgi:hypothetical protein